MSKYVLFSPLGMSDPTRGMKDGAFIHICRAYKPRKAYLYMSREICEYDRQDNRYERYLKLLCEKEGFQCAVEKIRRPDLEDVSNFDFFYNDMYHLIKKIENENPQDGIIINLSSGSPQMKSALFVICSLSDRKLIPVKVATPVLRSNYDEPVGSKYAVEIEWELNIDNDAAGFENRCSVVESVNFNALIKKDIIDKHIAAYDYVAALSVAETIPEHISEKGLSLIRAAKGRLSLDLGNAQRLARSAGHEILPVSGSGIDNDITVAFEYLLGLHIKIKRGEPADFIRGISPLLTDMFALYLKKKCSLDIEVYIDKKTGKLTRSKLPPDLARVLDNSFNGQYRDEKPTAAVLLPLVKEKGDADAYTLAFELREIEKKVRNIAAHEIVSVSDRWLMKETGFDSEGIYKKLRKFFLLIYAVPSNAWNSYDELNGIIKREIRTAK